MLTLWGSPAERRRTPGHLVERGTAVRSGDKGLFFFDIFLRVTMAIAFDSLDQNEMALEMNEQIFQLIHVYLNVFYI